MTTDVLYIQDGQLVIDGVYQDSVEKFVRGEGFVAGPYTFMYYDGLFWAPPKELAMPTQAELDAALQQEIAVTYKANASAA